MPRQKKESIQIRYPSDMRYIQAVYGTNVENEFPRHVHDKFCMGAIEQGARVIVQAGGPTVIPENALFIINPGTAHACKSAVTKSHSYLSICVDVKK